MSASKTPGATAEQGSGLDFRPPPPLADLDRLRAFMKRAGVDAVCVKEDAHLFYLSGHASDSSLCHFYDDWACAVITADEGSPGVLFVPDYDLAYQVTRPTWLPELRVYGSEWSSAASLMKEIYAGIGIETELRQPLRTLFERTRPTMSADLQAGIMNVLAQTVRDRPVTVACDDLRFAARLEAAGDGRIRTVDAQGLLRQVRAVKTEAEIALLRQAAHINDLALTGAAQGIGEGRPWADMVQGYRRVLAEHGAKPLGERGMLFNGGPDGGFVLDHEYVDRKRFARGDTVLLDAICIYRLYHADMARTAVIGEPSPKQRRMFEAVDEALSAAEDGLRPGVQTADLARRAAEVMRKHGFDPKLTTLVFHPIGLEIFDYADQADAFGSWAVEENAVVNFEVFYRDPEEGGMHLEDSLVVRSRGLDRLSTLPRDLIVVA